MASALKDVTSVSDISQFETNHYHFEWSVDLEAQRLSGTVSIQINRIAKDNEELHLDAFKLQINRILCCGDSLQYNVLPYSPYGNDLVITVPVKYGDNFDIIIDYVASEGNAICWLQPPMTEGKKYHYMYTQGQASLNRSLFPCQDTPSHRITYSAKVTVPCPLRAVMSAKQLTLNPKDVGGFYTYEFRMDQSIAPYLVALAVGDIQYAEIGPRSKVWTEPAYLDKARQEFSEITEKYMQTAESLFGPYLWEDYDLLVLPHSFPYGGMENPRLTFINPSIITGDKSLCYTEAHELSHSWFGNLVTNASWGEFWINEGFTMFAERKIVEKIHGKPLAQLEALTGKTNFMFLVDDIGADHEYTKLKINLTKDIDPDDTYNETPYEKGYCFVSYLEHIVNNEEEFLKWLKSYVNDYKFQCITSADVINHFFNHFPHLIKYKTQEGCDFDTWINKPGLPPVFPDLSGADHLTSAADNLAKEWSLCGDVSIKSINDWHPLQICYFLDQLFDYKLNKDIINKIINTYSLLTSENSEIRFRTCKLIVQNEVKEFYNYLDNFLTIYGKQKFLLPLYKLMNDQSTEMREHGIAIFKRTKDTIHKNVQGYIIDRLKI